MPEELAKTEQTGIILAEHIQDKIHSIRGQNVMLDSDLASLYGVQTSALNQAVSRNVTRFPEDFMFLLTTDETKGLISQTVISKTGKGGRRKAIHVFTEQGVAMLSSVLRSERAVQVNIAIMRAFVAMRGTLSSDDALARKILEMEQKYDKRFEVVFEAIRQLIAAPPAPERRMGFPVRPKGDTMKFVCYQEFDDPQEPTYPGLLYKGKTLPLTRIVAVAEALHPRGLTVPDDGNRLVATLPSYVEAVKELERGKALDLIWQEIGVTPAAPLPRPNRILAIGRNYADHAKEMGNEPPTQPIVFLKASSSVIADGRPIVLPPHVGRVDFEAELAVVIGRGGKNIPESEALSHVAGYTLFNDVTARDEQKRALANSLPWFLSKSYDTFGPMGPCLVTADEIPNPHALEITLSVNGEIKQQASTGDMIFSIPFLIAYLSQHLALEPGDVIATGTPPGIGPLHAGDTVEVRIPEIGTLTNPVIGEEE